MSERVRIAVIFAVVAIIFGGGAYYFFKIHRPAQVRANARDEIVAWEERWHRARSCLLGEHPMSARAGESLAVRELSPDPWDRGTCTAVVGKLVRGEGPESGLPDVEAAWQAIDASATHLAKAFAAHVDPGGEKPAQRLVDPLPKALDEVEEADAALRKAAGMEPPPATGAAVAALPHLATTALTADGRPIPQIDRWAMSSAHGAVAFAQAGDRQLQIVFTPGVAPVIAGTGAEERLALPAGDWTIAGSDGALSIGTTKLKVDGYAVPWFALGSPADGIAAYALGTQVGIAHMTKGHATLDKPFDTHQTAFGIDPSGRAAIAWSVPDGTLRAMLVRPGATPKVIELGSGDPEQVCLTADRAWLSTGDQYISFDESGGTPHVLPRENLVGCTQTAALLEHNTQHYAVCTDKCREVDLSAARYNVIATLANDKVVAVATRGNVIALWQEGGPSRFFTTDAPIDPRYALSDGKVVDVIAASEAGVVVARIPLR